MTTVLVTGGTGALGHHVVRRLAGAGAAVRMLSRRGEAPVPDGVALVHGDLLSGAGLEGALAGVDAVVHCASDPASWNWRSTGLGPRLDDPACHPVP